MNIRSTRFTVLAGVLVLFAPFAAANQAEDTIIIINGYTPGVTPFISKVSLTASDLSYDYIFISTGGCGNNPPLIIDTDAALRWVNPVATPNALFAASLLIDNAVYETDGPTLKRVELDGTSNVLADYSSLGVLNFHHNIDPGKTGILLEA